MSNEEDAPQAQEPEPSEEAVTTEEPSNGEAAEENADAPGESEEMNRPPFDLKSGARISYGQKKGSVISIRGNGKAPYEVGIRWAEEKHPQWMLFAALKLAYEQGTLVVKP
mgnify:FL=1